MKKNPVVVIAVIISALLMLLFWIEMYIGAAWFESDVLFVVEKENIQDRNGDPIEYQIRQEKVRFQDTYSFDFEASDIQVLVEDAYMLIYLFDNQQFHVFLNGNPISSSEKIVSSDMVTYRNLVVVPIESKFISKVNNIEVEMTGSYYEGLYNNVYFVDSLLLKKINILTSLGHGIRSFLLYAGIMVAIAFLGFSKTVVQYQNELKAKMYQHLSFALIFYVIYSNSFMNFLSLFRNTNLLFYFANYALILSLIIVTKSFYNQLQDNLIKRIYFFQIGLMMLTIGFVVVLPNSILFHYISLFLLFVLTLLASNIYTSAKASRQGALSIFNIRNVLLIVFIGQIIYLINFYKLILPINVGSLFAKTFSVSVWMIFFIYIVYNELMLIRLNNEEEHKKLKNLNTNIYEYVSEGIFSIAKTLIVNDMYTKVCQKVFGKDISGTKACELLMTEDSTVEFLERLFTDLFNKKIPWQAGVELLPEEIIISDRKYHLSYQKVMSDNHLNEIIVKTTDVTEAKNLEKQLVLERDKLSLSISSVMNREELLPLVNEFIEFIDNYESVNMTREEKLNVIHTYKGNFGVFNFINVLGALHDLESLLLTQHTITQEHMTLVVDELYKDLEIITEFTGSSFFEDTLYLKANVNNLESVYNEVKKYFYDTEASLIIFIIKKIFNRSMKDFILFYARETRKKASEKGIEIKTITVAGDDIFIDYNYYKNAIRSLVHIFNNCIDHGFEDEEERLLLGKPKYGEIQCRISDYGNFFEIVIRDDGRGIAIEQLAERLIEKGIITQEQLQELTEDELLEYVFVAEITTKDEASLTSGRGVGLASVKTEVEKVGGEIRIVSFIDFGTEVKILLPKENETLISYFSLPLLMDLYVEAFKIYIKSNDVFELPLNIVGSEKITSVYEYNVKIKFEGPEVGYFFLSCNKKVLWNLACYLTENQNLTEDEFEEIAWEVIKETCNIIAGNSTSIFDLNQKYINILSPDQVSEQYFDTGNLIYKWHMKYGDYAVVLGLILD